MDTHQLSEGYGRRRRFARLPHDRQVERSAKEWADECSGYRAIELLLPEIQRGAFLSHGRYGNRCVATLTRDGDQAAGMADAVSGWGGNAEYALSDLAFRWCILMHQTWMTAMHVPLVSEVQ